MLLISDINGGGVVFYILSVKILEIIEIWCYFEMQLIINQKSKHIMFPVWGQNLLLIPIKYLHLCKKSLLRLWHF